jgi:hypothetical protein
VDSDFILPKGAPSTSSLGNTENTEIDDYSIRFITFYTLTSSVNDIDNTEVDNHFI